MGQAASKGKDVGRALGNATKRVVQSETAAYQRVVQSQGSHPGFPNNPPVPSTDKHQQVLETFAVPDGKHPTGPINTEDFIRQAKERIEKSRPELFQRLDAPAQATTKISDDELLFSDATIEDKQAAEIAANAAAEMNTQVSVRKVLSSGPSAGHEIHEKNFQTVENVSHLQNAIQTKPDDSIGQRNFKLFEAMQMNPRLLDSGAVLASSPAHLIAAQMATGVIPDTARDDRKRLLGASASSDAVSGSTGLVSVDKADALVPLNTSVDDMLLADDTKKAVSTWAPRPPEVSPYDQLVLRDPDEEFQLERNELFELFARHKADPDFWTPEKLAAKFDTKVEWVKALLQYTSPPIYCQVDGEAYGVYEIRSMDAMPAQKKKD